MAAIGGHHRALKRGVGDDWVTPPAVIDALGPFDLDPACPDHMPWPTASTMWASGGLERPWHGLVWLNPPYSSVGEWMTKLADHGNGIAMIFARVETSWWFDAVWGRATAIAFPKGRFTFHYPDGSRPVGNSGAPSAFVAYGNRAAAQLQAGLSGLGGQSTFISGWDLGDCHAAVQ